MKILLDATAVPPDRGGVGRYVDNLVPALRRVGVEPTVVCRVADLEHYGRLSGRDPIGAPTRIDARGARLVWEQTGLPGLLRRHPAQVLHSPHYTFPVVSARGPRPLVVTLHDATFFTEPEVHTQIKGPFFRAATRAALRLATRCVVPSHATAAELVRVAGARADRLDVAHLGVDPAVFSPPSPEQDSQLRARLGLAAGERYVAFLGTVEPRKNVPALIEGWALACAGLGDPPTLVVAGGSGWDATVDAVAARVPPGLRLLRTGYLPVEHLAALLGGAEVVVYPSLGEGFGLPVLEAMACAATVLTTRRLALPEIGGDAVAYTEPDAAAIARALRALWQDPDGRARLASDGLARSALFTWDACAQAHERTYRAALQT